jgi:hypothetical protein
MAGQEGVALVVPSGYDAYVRLLHPLVGGERWSAIAPDYLAPSTERYPYPFPETLMQVEGDMGAALVDALLPSLTAATRVPRECHFGLWSGWGELHAGSQSVLYSGESGRRASVEFPSESTRDRLESTQPLSDGSFFAFVDACVVQPWWGGRDMLLFDGPIENVTAIGSPSPFDGSLRRRGPQWWWPADKAWFVATEIDYPWTYLGGSTTLIDTIIGDPTIEVVRVGYSDAW